MTYPPLPARLRSLSALAATLALFGGCQAEVGGPMGNPTGGAPGVGGTGGQTATGGGGGVGPDGCTGPEAAAPKRLVRLSFNQQVNAVRALFGDALATTIATTYEIGDPTDRGFPPLGTAKEGSVITDTQFGKSDAIAQALGKHVLDNFATLTTCGAAPTDQCAQQYVSTLAQRAFRRPLAEPETARLMGVYNQVKTLGGSIQEATQFGAYAIFNSPLYLYRTEFGADPKVEGLLSQYELAGLLSFFVTDAPPDQPLLDAAQQNLLTTPEQIAGHVTRLLETPVAKKNLEAAMLAYFGMPMLHSIAIPARTDFTAGVRNSMFHEVELFLANTLWAGKLDGMLTSRRTFINASLAPLYGVQIPAGAVLDADGFTGVDVPENRAGLLTAPGFLTARSRPDGESVVGRGLLVNATVLCAQNPPFPENLATQIEEVSAMLEGQSERQKAEYRGTHSPCNGCHTGFDPYGLALENYDILGGYRTSDEHGNVIDATVTLPPAAGGAMARSAAEMAAQLVGSGAFAACIANNFVTYALAEGSVTTNSCATRAVVRNFQTTDQSFASLMRSIATSTVFSSRSPGGNQ